MAQVITRFAPSPTGELHIGGARTALYAWAFARQHADAGQFLLRFEDTDRKRSSEAAQLNFIRDLQWLGLQWDNDPVPRQSERLELYDEAIARLAKGGLTYEEQGAVRLRMNHDVSFHDEVYGDISVKANDLEDFVIRKSDGFPTFHLAVVVDDEAMGVTHVIRGQEHLTNTTKHAALYDALGYRRPVWVHTPSIMNEDGSKMSKRDKAKAARKAAKDHLRRAPESADAFATRLARSVAQAPLSGSSEEFIHGFLDKKNDDTTVASLIANELGIPLPEIDIHDFRQSGYFPKVLCNYVALLGWNPGDDIERFDLEFLAERFSLDRINKSNARFDRDKLMAFNADVIRERPLAEFTDRLRQHLRACEPMVLDRLGDHFACFAEIYQPRSRTLCEPATIGRFFVQSDQEVGYDPKALAKVLKKNDGEGRRLLVELQRLLAACTDWTTETIDAALNQFADKKGVKLGAVAQPIRVAVSGGTVSPPLGQTLEILGKTATLARITRCLLLSNPEPSSP